MTLLPIDEEENEAMKRWWRRMGMQGYGESVWRLQWWCRERTF